MRTFYTSFISETPHHFPLGILKGEMGRKSRGIFIKKLLFLMKDGGGWMVDSR
jgi:hypothetical protein